MTQGQHGGALENGASARERLTRRRGSSGSQNSGHSDGSVDSRESLPVPLKHRAPRSAPHSRSCSFRNKSRSRELTVEQPPHLRRNSMPTPNLLAVPNSVSNGDMSDKSPKLHRVRSFKTTSKGVINRGDSFKKKSTHSLMSTGNTVLDHSQPPRAGIHPFLEPTRAPSVSSVTAPGYFRVIALGATDVGKSALVRQMMTSEYVGAFDNTEGVKENTVSVLLNGEESTVEFVDPEDKNFQLESVQMDAYIVVFSIEDHDTFDAAQAIVRYLRVDLGTDRAIILVANKIDLVRKRKVTAEEARFVCTAFDCKYAEVSAALSHHVDELLVGIVSQIRLKLDVAAGGLAERDSPKHKDKKQKGAKGLLSKLFRKSTKKSKSCDNLYTL